MREAHGWVVTSEGMQPRRGEPVKKPTMMPVALWLRVIANRAYILTDADRAELVGLAEWFDEYDRIISDLPSVPEHAIHQEQSGD